MELGHQREFRVAGPELTSCVDVAKGSLPRSNIQDVNKGSCLAEGAGDRRQCQQAHTGAEAESDPVQGHEDHRWDKNPCSRRTNTEEIKTALSFPRPSHNPPGSLPMAVESFLMVTSLKIFLE